MKLFSSRTFGSFCLTFCSLLNGVWGYETWSFPVEKEFQTLSVSNQSTQAQRFWVSGPLIPGIDSQERSYDLPPQGTERISLKEFQNQPWLKLNAEFENSLKVELELSRGRKFEIPAGHSVQWKIRARKGGELVLFNQAPFSQTLKIQTALQSLAPVTLDPFAKTRIRLPAWVGSSLLTVSGEARMNGVALSATGAAAFEADPVPAALKPSPRAAYFRLSNPESDQSFVVALTSPQLIQEAREQIRRPQAFLPRILIGEVAFGHGGHNRDSSSPGKPPWSWHIEKTFRFAELASQECNGTPALVEETLALWVESPEVICFWNYKVVEELTASQVGSGPN